MRYFLLLSLAVAGSAWSDLARQYPPGLTPGLYSGSAASNAAGSGMPEQAGKEKASHANRDSGHDYRDDRTR